MPKTTWQWQLTGILDTSMDVTMYDIDLFDSPQATIDQLKAAGRKVVCYFSAGSWEDWRSDAGAFPESIKGNELDGFANEKWLDIRDIATLAPIMRARLDTAVAKGCDGVEPDNVDGYTNNSGFALSADDQLAYNLWLSNEANARGLSIGLKNDLDQISTLEPFFDWALNEQCFEFNECSALQSFITANKAVFGVEYTGDPAQFCPSANTQQFSWLKKNLDLDAWRIDCQDINLQPEITTPLPNAVLSGSSENFAWAANDATILTLWLYIGKSVGASDIYDSGNLGTATTLTVNGLPTDSSTLHVRLWYQSAAQGWQSVDYTYTAADATAPGKANLISPSGNISDNTPTYSWDAVAGSSWYYLWVDDSSGNKINQWYRSADAACESGTGTCSVTPTTVLTNGSGSWWIQTYNTQGYGPWSAPMSFDLQ